jgi:hypothetical protein
MGLPAGSSGVSLGLHRSRQFTPHRLAGTSHRLRQLPHDYRHRKCRIADK